MTKTKKIKPKLKTYLIVRDKVEQGMGFALNRLDDCMPKGLPERARSSALDRMVSEVMMALDDVIDWGDDKL